MENRLLPYKVTSLECYYFIYARAFTAYWELCQCQASNNVTILQSNTLKVERTRDVFYVRREVDLMKTAKVNAYIMHIFGKIELLSIPAT